MNLYFVLLFILAFCGFVSAQIEPIKDLKPTVILISLDGFRPDYLEKFQPKTLNELARTGVRAKWMTPSFPSKTFPNHYTIATGLYPEHHGIIENNIYDKTFDAVFGLNKREEVQNSRWWQGEPIWVTAEKQGQRAVSFFFVGSETEIMGVLPTFWVQYNGAISNQVRVDTMLAWLDVPQKERPTLFTLYFSDTDDAGHEFSPDSEETRQAVLKVDSDIKRLMDGLKRRKIADQVNVIIVSDHGMATVNLRNAVFLDDYINFDDTERILWTREIVQIFPKKGKEDEIVNKLKAINHATCWRKSEIPERFHYRDNPRIAPVVCSTEEGWLMTNHKSYEDTKARNDMTKPRGGHGYDNQLPSMRATFIAHGAAFKKGYVAEPFENVNVYNVITKILHLTPAPNDGNFTVADQILR